MDDAPFLMFLGYLAAMEIVALDFDGDKGTYVERTTGKTVGEIVREFLGDMRGIQKTEQ